MIMEGYEKEIMAISFSFTLDLFFDKYTSVEKCASLIWSVY